VKRTPQKVIDLLNAEIPAKISRNKFCLQTGINQNSIDKYMAGIAEPTQASMEKLAAYFKVPAAYLRGDGWMFGDPNKPIALCARCGEALTASIECFYEILPNGEKREEDPVVRVWPCKNCCKDNK